MKKKLIPFAVVLLVFAIVAGGVLYIISPVRKKEPPGPPVSIKPDALNPPPALPEGADRIYYSEYGAVGDGIADDFGAIIAAHAAANAAGLPVCADPGAAYYIGASGRATEIQTDTYWGDARFIIDDSVVPPEDGGFHVFRVTSALPETQITSVETLHRGQEKLDISLDHASLIFVTDDTQIRYIREGKNQNSGSPQQEVFVVGRDGSVDADTPVIWDYDSVSSMTAYPIDPEPLTISGGRFTTISNQAPWGSPYYARGIDIRRSNVVVDGLYHDITGETDGIGAPYGGFISISRCANVLVCNTMLSSHQSVASGTYDIGLGDAANVTFRECWQLNSIHDDSLWSIMGSNHCKNLTYDTVELSRFDAHQGVWNATIKNSVIRRISLIGGGTALIENTKIYGTEVVNLREDYGSTWDGDIAIRNCEFIPISTVTGPAVIASTNKGLHDFGYACRMPRKISIDGLAVDDAALPAWWTGPQVFSHNLEYTLGKLWHSIKKFFGAKTEFYPYGLPEEVEIHGLAVSSGKRYLRSVNPFLFRKLKGSKS